jgi:hypothetical protein
VRRLVRYGILALAGVIPFVVFASSSASAEAPGQQGWWTTTNLGSVPELGATVPVSTAPDVPAEGLLVQGGQSSTMPAAYAALIYPLDPGITATTLTLTVHTQSATTPGTTLEICPLADPAIVEEQGGPISDAPAYDCSHGIKASPSSNGMTYTFDVSMWKTQASLAVAVLPTSTTDRVVFDQPSDHSLATTGTPTGSQGDNNSSPGGALPNDQSTINPLIPAPVPGPPSPFASGASSPVMPTTTTPVPFQPATPPGAASTHGPVAIAPLPLAVSIPGPVALRPLTLALVLGGALVALLFWVHAGNAAVRRAMNRVAPPQSLTSGE